MLHHFWSGHTTGCSSQGKIRFYARRIRRLIASHNRWEMVNNFEGSFRLLLFGFYMFRQCECQQHKVPLLLFTSWDSMKANLNQDGGT